MIPIARIYYRTLPKANVFNIFDEVVRRVSGATEGRVIVAGVSTDGEFQPLRCKRCGSTGVSYAQASIQVVDEVISKAAAGLGLATNTAVYVTVQLRP